jgi:hypothetical protein
MAILNSTLLVYQRLYAVDPFKMDDYPIKSPIYSRANIANWKITIFGTFPSGKHTKSH